MLGSLVPLSTVFNLISLLVLLASVLASAKPVWLNFYQPRGPTYSYNNGSKEEKLMGAFYHINCKQYPQHKGSPRDLNKRSKEKLTCYVKVIFAQECDPCCCNNCDTLEFDQGHVTKNRPITMHVLKVKAKA